VVLHAVPCGKDKSAREGQKREEADAPADDVRAGESLLAVRNCVQILLWGTGEKALVLYPRDAGIENQEIAEHDHEDGKNGDAHGTSLLCGLKKLTDGTIIA